MDDPGPIGTTGSDNPGAPGRAGNAGSAPEGSPGIAGMPAGLEVAERSLADGRRTGTSRPGAPGAPGIATRTGTSAPTGGDGGFGRAGGLGSGSLVLSGGGGTPSAGLGWPITTQLPAGS